MTKKHPGGRPTGYDEDYHIKLLYEVFNSGGSRAHFCAEAEICGGTFNRWKNMYKNFRKAYEKCLQVGEAMSLRKLDNPPEKFNFPAWKFRHLNQYIFPHRRKAFNLKENTVEGKLKALWKSLRDGYLTPGEYSQLVGAVLAEGAKAASKEGTANFSFKGVSDEAIKAYMAVMSGKKVKIEE